MKPDEKFIVPIVAKTAAEAKSQILGVDGDVAELRLDAMEGFTAEELKELAGMRKMVMTDRRAFEGGFKTQTDTERFDAIHSAIEAKPWAVDLEIQSPRMFRRKLIQLAHKMGVKIISSYHNLKKTPPAEKLLEMVEEVRSDSDYVKIVCTPHSEDDVTALLDLVRRYPGKVAAFGLGEKYAYTRILSLSLGAPFGYAKGKTSTAPGQLTVDEMRRKLAEKAEGKKP